MNVIERRLLALIIALLVGAWHAFAFRRAHRPFPHRYHLDSRPTARLIESSILKGSRETSSEESPAVGRSLPLGLQGEDVT